MITEEEKIAKYMGMAKLLTKVAINKQLSEIEAQKQSIEEEKRNK
jgi:hypothetical protein|tara:strand:+ start:562 stop:696 length:135 start_codon:yes stop_codon:yes gene_type:complete